MPQYQFTYSDPYEFDDDDSRGSEHDIGWGENKATFEAEDDEKALKIVEEKLNKTIEVLGRKKKIKPTLLVKIVKKW